MPIQVSYMGTKRIIAPEVASIIGNAPPGPLLDLFSGVCAVGAMVAPSRQLWCNDIQYFASMVAEAFFASPDQPMHFDNAADAARKLYKVNAIALEGRFSYELRIEEEALQKGNFHLVAALEEQMPNVAFDQPLANERSRLNKAPKEAPYRLFTITYSGGYLGLRQSIQVDSIKYAIDNLLYLGTLSKSQHRWLSLALCQAVSKVSTTTGHFAQYMRVKEKSVKRFCSQRSRSVWKEWLLAISGFSPIGTSEWRSKNYVFREDADRLLPKLKKDGMYPAVVYADPPYTADHYSRYYHLLETVLLYDYPQSHGRGRYRPDRFASIYSTKTKVAHAIDRLISDCARLGSQLVLSYPEKGLLVDPRSMITSAFKKHFGSGGLVSQISHYHSSLGGSKGRERNQVKELIFAVSG